jgi:hypothetical protein
LSNFTQDSVQCVEEESGWWVREATAARIAAASADGDIAPRNGAKLLS